MTEPENTDTAVIDRELAAIDSALEAGATTASDPYELELQELALALAADADHPAPPFAAELSRKVSDGFPRGGGSAAARSQAPPDARAGRGGFGAAGAGGRGGSGVQRRRPRRHQALRYRRQRRARRPCPPLERRRRRGRCPRAAELAARGRTALPPEVVEKLDSPLADGFAPGRKQRIERSAALTLAAPGDELDKVADGVNTVTERHNGFVLRSNLTTGDEGTTGGSFELRIPASRLQAALGDLAKLADVRGRSQAGQDVTREYANAADRLQAARAQRRSLLRRLENAMTDQQTEALRQRLDANAGEIRTLRAQIRDLRLRTDYAKVTVTLDEDEKGGGATGSGSSDGLGGAVDDALGTLGDSVEILIRTLGVAIPVGLILLGFTLGGRSSAAPPPRSRPLLTHRAAALGKLGTWGGEPERS